MRNQESAAQLARVRHVALVSVVSVLAACAPDATGPNGFAGVGSNGGVGGTGSVSGSGGIGGAGFGGSGGAGFGGVGGAGGIGGGGNGGVGGDREPLFLDETNVPPANLTPDEVTRLMTGSNPGTMRLLYPYTGTVFPRGILPPEVMWEGEDARAIYLHIRSQLFEYKGLLIPTDNPRGVSFHALLWSYMGQQTLGKNDPFTIEVTILTPAGTVIGPVSTQVIVAQATLKGSIYYNSYSSPLAAGSLPTPAGAVLRIASGSSAEVLIGGGPLGVGNCHGCHSVSANGQRLMTGGVTSGSYAISNDINQPAMHVSAGVGAEFSGLSPEGSVYATSAHPNGIGPRSAGAMTTIAELHETDTGMLIANSGLPAGAMMPTFSPDGRLVTFSDFALGDGHGIAVMDYDPVMRRVAGYRDIYTDATRYAGWPFMLPDNRAVVYTLGQSSDFSGFGAGLLPGVVGMPSELYISDINSKTTTILARAMGYATPADYATNTTYLPFGAPELHQNYYPTVSPVAAGGYFWVFFDCVRHYGNRGLVRQLWGTAITISPDGRYESDPSHPAFYLPGQEFGTGNHRAFTALDPCRDDGEGCETGIDCCSGFCTDGVCGTPEQRCSQTNEACTIDDDCCDSSQQCFAGFCGETLPPD